MKTPYDFRSWKWVVNGGVISGFAKGDGVVKVERNSDSYSWDVGADGRLSVYRSADRSAKITFKLAPNSESNTFLGALMDLQEGGFPVFVPIVIGAQDIAQQDVFAGTKGVMLRPPGFERGATPGDQEWSIITERGDFKYGGGTVFDL